jgi:hypothetical protein
VSFITFDFDLPGAVVSHLLDDLEALPSSALSLENISQTPEQQGVYALFKDAVLVYIGKTEHGSGLKKRLHRHLKRISHRQGLSSDNVSYKA